MINATAVHAFELDDVGPGGHNGSVTLSSALAIAEHRYAIDEHMTHADCVLLRFGKCCLIVNFAGVKHRQISKVSGL